MCIILDTNRINDFVKGERDDMRLLREWWKKKGRLAYAPTKKFLKEWKNTGKYDWLMKRRGAQKVKIFSLKKVEDEIRKMPKIKSDDPHVIALARLAKVRLLVTGDNDLIKDFTNPKIIKQGKIYPDTTKGYKGTPRTYKKLLDEVDCS